VHDYFDILGVARDARPPEIRRACCRARATHPDIWDGDQASAARRPAAASERRAPRELFDAAVDFVDAATLVDAMRAAFFATRNAASS
jgi:curved DNA-binding protein CbpA